MAEPAAAPQSFDAEAYVEQASRLVGIEVAAPFRPGVVANIGLIARMAELVMGLPLAIDAEPAPVFHPGGPDR